MNTLQRETLIYWNLSRAVRQQDKDPAALESQINFTMSKITNDALLEKFRLLKNLNRKRLNAA